tara:strand:- start:136 stop:402 length:267 start_codon:yes stop_codon:yes gene_type:complete
MMPKGFKTKNGYGTTKELGGATYHEVAQVMNEKGFKMNHSSARNIYISAMMKIAREVSNLYELKHTDKEIKSIAIDPDFQSAVSDFIK